MNTTSMLQQPQDKHSDIRESILQQMRCGWLLEMENAASGEVFVSSLLSFSLLLDLNDVEIDEGVRKEAG